MVILLLVGLFLPLMLEIEATKGGNPLDASTVASVFLYLHDHLFQLIGLYLFLATLSAIRFSHRIAGPMLRFKRRLYEIGDGKFSEPLRTRDSDYMQSEVRALNAMSHSLLLRTQDIVHSEAALRAAIEEMQAALRPGEDARVDARLQKLLQRAADLQECVGFFAEESPDAANEIELPVPNDEVELLASSQ
ncbi:MAG: hypothetical protein CSA62_00830 [Planctomycetota bacterium]|nr:MAG: hypothetical protein CSA62_00830 [Planctomycetota bacterium]